ncbi:hypothetical protein FO519_008157 [Halicephalobus sp. NKZ332]|nr:hypothetical protein FO519_008157 [Halicephalobus sp. NKZ332]
MASGSRGRGDRGRNRRFLENLQQSMGAGPGLRKPQRQKIQASSEDLPKDFEDFLRILQMEKKNVSLSELGDYYKENYEGYEDDQVADIAEILFKIGFEGSAIYDFVGFLNIGFADERLQQKMANEFIVHAAGLFDLEEPELSKYEDFGRFIGLLLKAKFNRPYHQISDSSNRFLVAVMSVFLGFLSEVPVLLESGDEVDLKNAKWKTTAVIAAVKALNRRLKSLLDVLIEMEKYSVAGAPPSKTEVCTQTVE